MAVQYLLHNSIRISFSVESAGVGKVRAAHEAQVLEAYRKVSILLVMHSVLDWDSEHSVPWPNVFMLALAFSPEWVPDVFLFFLFFFMPQTWSTVTRWDLTLLHKPPDYTHKLAPFNESDDFFKEKLHPFKPVQHISQRDAEKNCLPSIYGECKPQRQKWDMCKLLWMHSILCDECSMYNMRREKGGVAYLCPLYLYSSGFGKEKKKQIKGMLFQSKERELVLQLSSIQSSFQLFF